MLLWQTAASLKTHPCRAGELIVRFTKPNCGSAADMFMKVHSNLLALTIVGKVGSWCTHLEPVSSLSSAAYAVGAQANNSEVFMLVGD